MAARLTVETVLLSLARAPSWTDRALVAAIDAAGAVIRQRREKNHGRVDMVSTVAVLCIDAGVRCARWAHLGDTRILFFRRGAVTLLTRDHSVRQSFVDASLVADDPLAAGPNRSALYAAVGAEGDIRPRVGECLPIEDGDAFLVCSDGVWDTVDADGLAMLLYGSESAQAWIGAIDAEVRRSARPQQDNYTAIGIWIGSPAEITIIRT